VGIKRGSFVLFVVVSLLATAHATTRRPHSRARRAHRPARHVRRIVWHPLFPGSHAMLVRQNEWLDQVELPRIATEAELIEREQAEELVPVESTRTLSITSSLPENRRYCRSWTRDFIEDLSEAYYREFHQPIVVTSLVRTMEQQKKLRRRNRNAGPVEGDTASTHLTGVTVDILKRGMTQKQHRWIEQYFMPLKEAGFIDPVEERRQPVFHVVVFKSYGEPDDAEDSIELPDPLTFANDMAVSTSK
jgi:uncharacterized protein YcbK (DUF882 family)